MSHRKPVHKCALRKSSSQWHSWKQGATLRCVRALPRGWIVGGWIENTGRRVGPETLQKRGLGHKKVLQNMAKQLSRTLIRMDVAYCNTFGCNQSLKRLIFGALCSHCGRHFHIFVNNPAYPGTNFGGDHPNIDLGKTDPRNSGASIVKIVTVLDISALVLFSTKQHPNSVCCCR